MSAVPYPNVSEASFQRAVIAYARSSNYLVAHHHDSRRQIRPGVFVGDTDAAGLPDLIIAGHGVLIFAELKAEKGRLSPAQERWRNVLQAVESLHPVMWRLWRPSDWPLIERELSHWAKGGRVA